MVSHLAPHTYHTCQVVSIKQANPRGSPRSTAVEPSEHDRLPGKSELVEIDMESALRPRDIQARIRAGEPVEDVAQAAGVPVERLAAFAAPVLAERGHVAGLAQTHPVRRRGEAISHRNLRNAVVDHLARTGVDTSLLVWDSWKVEDRKWRVVVRFQDQDDEPAEASFTYDQASRFSIAADELGRDLIDDQIPPVMEVGIASSQASQDDVDQDAWGSSPEVEEPAGEPLVSAEDYTEDSDDAYPGGELAEVDGVYDIVPPTSNLDVLYDMLSSFDEDSVKIYSGLVDPKQVPSQAEALQAAMSSEPEPTTQLHPPEPPQTQSSDQTTQPSLLGDGADEPTQPVRKQGRRKRASVPSWDEIMFGAPKKNDR